MNCWPVGEGVASVDATGDGEGDGEAEVVGDGLAEAATLAEGDGDGEGEAPVAVEGEADGLGDGSTCEGDADPLGDGEPAGAGDVAGDGWADGFADGAPLGFADVVGFVDLVAVGGSVGPGQPAARTANRTRARPTRGRTTFMNQPFWGSALPAAYAGYGAVIWPRISPSGEPAVWTFT